MSYVLIDLVDPVNEFPTSVWNWKAAVEVIRHLGVIDQFTARKMVLNGSGVKISMEDAHEIGLKLRVEILPKLKPNKRIFADLSITDSPDDGTFHEHGADAWKNYSVGAVWVEDFSDFVLRSKGFQVF